MLREEQQNQYPFVKVDEFGRVYLSEEDAKYIGEIKRMVSEIYDRVVNQKIVRLNDLSKIDRSVVECCKEGAPSIHDPGAFPPIWDPGVSIPEGFTNDNFQPTEEIIHGHKVKFTSKDCGYIDGEYFERTDFTRQIECFRNGWNTPDEATRSPQ